MAALCAKCRLAQIYASKHTDSALKDEPVTVLQPILSGDPALEQVLAANLRIASPRTTFCWLVDQEDAEARRIWARLSDASPDRARLILCPPPAEATNPKTAKLARGLREVATPYVAVLDDDTMLSSDILPRAVAALHACELYTGLPRYTGDNGWWSSLLAHFVNNNSAMTYLPMAALRHPITINGMFYVMRTDVLRGYGGFEPILPMLCDDYALARLVRSCGGRIHQSIAPQMLRTTINGPLHYVRVMHRWMVFANRLLRDQSTPTAALIVVLMGLPPALLWVGLLSLLGGPWFWGFVPATAVLRHVVLRSLHRRLFGGASHLRPGMSLVAELLQPLHLVHSYVQRTIRWRTRRILVHANGTFSYLTAP